MAPEPPAPPPADDIADAPAPVIEDDPTLEGMDLEIEQFNRFARDRGLIGDVYFDFDKYDLKPEDRDRLVYSKGHACPALYAVLADLGFFSLKDLAFEYPDFDPNNAVRCTGFRKPIVNIRPQRM